MTDYKPRKKHHYFWWFAVIIVLLFGIFSVSLSIKTQLTLNQITVKNEGDPLPDVYLDLPTPGLLPEIKDSFIKPDPEPDRLDVLLLGIRGVDDPYGGSLSDAIVVASIDTKTHKAAMLSIPRDLYVYIPGQSQLRKVNFAYAEGRAVGGEAGGLRLARDVVANITGVHIDHVVRIDFEAFQKIIDAVGGVTVYLDKDFVEPYQWSEEGEFRVPAGKNHMDGITALYYTRSRYSTSDFDRARRQQQVLLALRDRVMSLGVLTKPTFAFQILDILGNHVRTDATPQEIRKLIDLARTVSVDTINTKVLDTSAGGLLSQDTIDGQYVLLPRTGTYEEIRALAKNLLQ